MLVVCKYMLFGGWMVVGWYILRAGTVALLGGRKGEEGRGRGRERRYLCVCIYSGEKREERSYRERCSSLQRFTTTTTSAKTTAIYLLHIQIHPFRYTQQSGKNPSSRVNRCIHQNLSTHPHQTSFLLSKQSHCPASTSLQLKLD